MSEILKKIKERGYWRIVIRPTDFKQDKIQSLDRAFHIIEKSAVLIENRGWTFPHVDKETKPQTGDDWVGQELDWHIHVELWRLYKSGQFLYMGGIWDDWRDQSIWSPPHESWKAGASLYVGDVIYRFMETFELAARLALTEAGSNEMYIEAMIIGLNERVLKLGLQHRAPLERRTILDNHLEFKQTIQREELISKPHELALSAALDIFNKYKWFPSMELLRSLLREMMA